MRRTLRWMAAVVALALVVPVTFRLEPAEAQAQPPLSGEAIRTDTWVGMTDINPATCPVGVECFPYWDTQQGYAQTREASYWKGGSPDCMVTTGRAPHNLADPNQPSSTFRGHGAPTGLATLYEPPTSYTYDQDTHQITNLGPNTFPGSDLPRFVEGSYWVHTQQDDEVSTKTVCGRALVTTDAAGQFVVNFVRPLQATPAFVVWSIAGSNAMMSDDGSGNPGDPPTGKLTMATSATGFTGKLVDNEAVPVTSAGSDCCPATFIIDYWADTRIYPIPTDSYFHRGTQVTVTTDANGDAVINYTDFPTGKVPSSIQVMGVNTLGAVEQPYRIVAHQMSSQQATIRVWKGKGSGFSLGGDNRLKNTAVKINYVAVGPQAGSPRPWNDQGGGGWCQLDCDSDRTINGVPAPDLVCGQNADGSDACFRWKHNAGNLGYFFEQSFIDMDVANTQFDFRTSYRNAASNWSTIDSANPNMIEVPILGASAWQIKAEDIGTMTCADQGALVNDVDYNDGATYIIGEVTRHNTNPAANFGQSQVPLAPGRTCGIQGTYRHEIGHGYGLGHNEEATSIMNSANAHGMTTIPLDDQVAFRSMYGYSGSLYAQGLKTSDMVRVSPGLSVGVIRVTGKGQAKLVKGFPTTPVQVDRTSWVGSLPPVVAIRGGTAGGKVALGLEHAPLAGFKPGTQWLVQVRDADGEVVEALPVQGGQVRFRPDMHAADDIDGGDPLVVSLQSLRAKAARR